MTLSLVVSPKEILEKVVDDPLQEGKQTTPKKVGETSLPSPPKQTPKVLTQNAKQKKAMREVEEEVDEDYIYKFIDHYVYKTMERGFKDAIQC